MPARHPPTHFSHIWEKIHQRDTPLPAFPHFAFFPISYFAIPTHILHNFTTQKHCHSIYLHRISFSSGFVCTFISNTCIQMVTKCNMDLIFYFLSYCVTSFFVWKYGKYTEKWQKYSRKNIAGNVIKNHPPPTVRSGIFVHDRLA